MREKKTRITPEILFFIVALIGIGCMLSMLIVSGGGVMERMVYDESRFCDFWAHINRLLDYDNIYGNLADADAIFPPLAYGFLAFFARCVRPNGVDDIAGTGFGILIFIMYLMIFMTGFIQILDYDYRAHNRLLRVLLPFVFLFSYPFWGFAFERGNLVMYAMLFLYIGLALRNHPNKIVREISLICVAISAGFKIYPALFGLLWLVEKRYKEALRLIAYGLAAFFLPFIFFGGPQGLFDYIKIFFGYLGRNSYARTSIAGSCIALIGEPGRAVGRILILVWVVWILFYLFSERKITWKTIALLTSTQTIIIPESYVYTYVFIVIPCVFFLKETASFPVSEKYRKLDYLYAILFACVFTVPFFPLLHFRVLFAMYACWVSLLLLISVEKIFYMAISCHIVREKV